MLNAKGTPPTISLKRNFSWILFGNLFYGASQWLMLIIIAKLGSPETVGKFSLALAVTAPVILFSNLNLRAVFATDAKNKHTFGDYLSLRVIMQVAGLVIILSFIFISNYSETIRILIMLIGLAKVFESISDILFGFFQKNERMDLISVSLTVKSVLSLVGLWIGMYFTNNIVLGTAGITIAWFLVLIFYDVPRAYTMYMLSTDLSIGLPSVFRHIFVGVNGITLKTLALLSLPLGVTFLFTSLMNNVPRYFLEYTLGERILGIYSAMVYVVFIGIRIVTALGESAVPRLSRYFAQRKIDDFKNLFKKMISVAACTGLIGIIISATCGKPVLTLLYRPEYAEYSDVFLWLMITAAIMYVSMLFEYGMNAVRKFKIQPYVLFSSLVTVTLICWIMIPRIGMLGAVIAVAFGYLFQLLCYWKVIKIALS